MSPARLYDLLSTGLPPAPVFLPRPSSNSSINFPSFNGREQKRLHLLLSNRNLKGTTGRESMTEEDEGDPQRIKRIAAATYEYERDPRWSEYWSNVLIPPRLASRSDVVDHFKRKFYQKYIDPDLIVGPMPSTSFSQSSRPNTSGSPVRSEQERPKITGSSTGTSKPTQLGSQESVSWNHCISQIFIYALFISTSLCIAPLVPRNISNVAYRLSLLIGACSSIYFLCTFHGVPNFWSMTSIQDWLQSVFLAKDFTSFVYCLLLLPFSANLKFALLPLLCREVEHSTKSLKRYFSLSSSYRKLFEKVRLWLEQYATAVNNFSSCAEIALGFLLALSLFSSQRNIILTFLYWHLLKIMYRSPATAGYHQVAWSTIGQTMNPYINRYIPFVNTPLSAIQRWWLT